MKNQGVSECGFRKINQNKRQSAAIFPLPILIFSTSKPIIRVYKYVNHCEKRFQRSRKTSATLRKYRDIVPQISVHALNGVSITLIMRVSDVSPRIDHINVSKPIVCAISGCLRRTIYNPLNSLR
jgi:hypothetical protein